jgi:hypothetical protein
MMSKVMLIGLVSGEQVVGKVDDVLTNDPYINIKNPAILVAGEKGLGMAPWLLYTNAEKDGVSIKTSNMVFSVEPRIEIVNQYNTQYGNGLVLPAQGIQTPELKIVAD